MTAATKAFNEGGKNANHRHPPGSFTGTILAEDIATFPFKNFVQYLFLFNHGPDEVRVGWHNSPGFGVDGDDSANPEKACFHEVPAGTALPLPAWFGKLYIKNPHATSDTRVSFTVIFSDVECGQSDLTGTDNFDYVEEISGYDLGA